MRRLRRVMLFLLAAAVAGEIAVRLWDALAVEGKVGALASFLVLKPDYWTVRPRAIVVQPEAQGDVTYRFNRDGFRDRDADPAFAGTTVLFLGDSVTFGLGVEDEDTFVRLLEARLPRPGRAVNLGMFAYAPVNEAAVLEAHGWARRPSLIVLQLYQNDLYLGKATAGSPVQPTLGNRARAVRQWILNSSALYRRSYQALHAVAYKAFHRYRREHPEKLNGADPQMIAAMLAAHPHDADFESLAIVEKMHAEAVRRGIPLLVVLTPNEAQLFFDRYDRIEERVGAFCRARGIPFHAALPMLRARPDRVDLYVDGLHFSPAGHRAIADWLAPFLANALAQPAW